MQVQIKPIFLRYRLHFLFHFRTFTYCFHRMKYLLFGGFMGRSKSKQNRKRIFLARKRKQLIKRRKARLMKGKKT